MERGALQIVGDPIENNFDRAVVYGFEDAWTLYPKKESRKDALKAWGQVVLPAETILVITAIYNWRRVWAQRESRYIPLMASWLRSERFYDEIPPEFVSRPSSHAPVKEREDTERTEMPDHVRAAIAKFRKG